MEREFHTPGRPALEVRVPAGRVKVTTAAGDRTFVRLEPLRDNAASRRAADGARVELQGTGAGQTVMVDVRDHSSFLPFSLGVEIAVTIEAPTGAKLRASGASADISAHGVLTELDVRTASGDVTAEEVSDKASVRAASGDVRIARVGGDLSVHSASGRVAIETVEGPATVRSASGDIEFGTAHSSVTVNTASGDAVVGTALRGRIVLQSASGDLEVGIPAGVGAYIDAKSVSGKVESSLDVSESSGADPSIDLRASSVSGDIRIRRAPEPHRQSSSVFFPLLA